MLRYDRKSRAQPGFIHRLPFSRLTSVVFCNTSAYFVNSFHLTADKSGMPPRGRFGCSGAPGEHPEIFNETQLGHSGKSDDSAPKPPCPPSVVWAQELGPKPYQQGQSYAQWKQEFETETENRQQQQQQQIEAFLPILKLISFNSLH
eukprot:1160564-Pelagomonas_calceolata.AAC.18